MSLYRTGKDDPPSRISQPPYKQPLSCILYLLQLSEVKVANITRMESINMRFACSTLSRTVKKVQTLQTLK